MKFQKFRFSIIFLYNSRCKEKEILKYVKIQKFRFSIVFMYNYPCTEKKISGYVKIQKFRFSRRKRKTNIFNDARKIQKFRFSIVFTCIEEEIRRIFFMMLEKET